MAPNSTYQIKTRKSSLKPPQGWTWECDLTFYRPRWILRIKKETVMIDMSNDQEHIVEERRSQRLRHCH